jgi:hypothetical protein
MFEQPSEGGARSHAKAPEKEVPMLPKSNIVLDTLHFGQSVVESAGRAVATIADGAAAVISQADRVIRFTSNSMMTTEQVTAVRDLFDSGDVRKDGTLDKQELRHVLHQLTGKWLSKHDLDVMWVEFDTSGDGRVDFKEFLSHAGPVMCVRAQLLAASPALPPAAPCP